MRVLYLITNNSLADGIARHILNITSYFAGHPEYDVEPAVCIAMPQGDLSEALKQNGVRVYCLNALSGHDPKILLQFHRVIKEFKPDLIHSHVMALMERIYLGISGRKIPLVGTIHGITMEHLGGKFSRPVTNKDKIEKILYHLFPLNVKKQIYISRGVQKFYHGTAESVYVYNPMKFEKIPPRLFLLHKLLGLTPDTPVIGTACRISAPKDPEAFTEVMCRVLAENPSAHAVVCGSGEKEDLEKLEQIVAGYGVRQRFHWLGYRKDAPELVRDLDCFIMTSVTEGLPTALLEAIASKTPVAFMETNGGMIDMAELHRTEGPIGICVGKDEKIKMAAEIAELLKQKESFELTENAFRVCQKHFSMPVIIEKLQKIYSNVI